MTVRGTVLNVTEQLVTEDCIECGVMFALPQRLRSQLVQSHDWFYCPNGHRMQYTGPTEAEKLRRQLEEQDRVLTRERALRDRAEAEAEHQRARARGYKGAAVKARKRAASGVCPAPGCKRSFMDLARHVASQHPELTTAAEDT